jgi:CRISPR system Cascade subunit CasE
MMYFSRVVLDPRAITPDIFNEMAPSGAYETHQLLWKLFPHSPEANRDFLYRLDESPKGLSIYLVSSREPRANGLPWRIETKQYGPKLKSGQILSFSLRANPVVTRPSPDGKRRLRHDVIMDEKHRQRQNSDETQTIDGQQLVAEAGYNWLAQRSEKNGFLVRSEDVFVFGYRQHRLEKPGRKSPIRYSSIDYQGRLTVSDPDLFVRALFKGIGRSKAFGCGLMLVKRV